MPGLFAKGDMGFEGSNISNTKSRIIMPYTEKYYTGWRETIE